MPYILMSFNAKDDPQYRQVLTTVYPEKLPIRHVLREHIFGESLDPAVSVWLQDVPGIDPYSIVAYDGTVYWWTEQGEPNPGIYMWESMPLTGSAIVVPDEGPPQFVKVTPVKANSWYDRAAPKLSEVLMTQPQVEFGYDDDEWRRPTHAGMGGSMYLREASRVFWQLLLSLLGLLILACVLIQIGIAAGWFPRGNR